LKKGREGAFVKAIFLASIILFSGVCDGESLRFAYAWEQGFDDSCGLQCLACFLGLYWATPATEWELAVEKAGLAAGPATTAEAGRNRGLAVSMGDLLALARAHGFTAEAWRTDYGGLIGAARDYAPLIAHYARPIGHFVIILAADADCVAVADPAAGLLSVARQDFTKRWSGAILLATCPGKTPDRSVIAAALSSLRGRRFLLDRQALPARADLP
jgi:ABC-type bacteriocin/lantibiotic exporter with double-glycine peptidase domain